MLEGRFRLAVADERGRLYEHPRLAPAGRAGESLVALKAEDLIPLPEGATLTLLPGRAAVGVTEQGAFRRALSLPGLAGHLFAVGALLPMGYARTYLPAAFAGRGAPPLPLFGYTAVAFRDGKVYTAAVQVEPDNTTWHPRYYNTADLPARVEALRAAHPQNRILRQLARCALEYGCFTAQNIFYRRWEGGIPVSPACNARCLGCISKQVSECCPSPQERIGFFPTEEEIVEVAAPHLAEAEGAIVSFGQGCEGEPTLAEAHLEAAVRRLRACTRRGVININTNGSRPAAVRRLAQAGLNSVRVSLISPQEEIFSAYVRPQGYGLAEVKETLRVAREEGLSLSLNYLIFPGVSDREEEVEALIRLLRERPVDLVQLRNLNIDPDVYGRIVPPRRGRLLGIRGLIGALKREFPHLLLGSFTHA
ncbi:MAG: hypothetical protein PWP58_608 [Bacillota bacterium]|jgi:pyruvate-formate lyase-activating enzyme|nr:hypothetical protein [Bacillota bacterium]